MADRPILFSRPMIRALLDGTKTQTRRVIKPRSSASLFGGGWTDDYVLDPGNADWRADEVHFAVGDRLWVRESIHRSPDLWKYVADDAEIPWPARGELAARRRDNLPSIFMPRIASRLTLAVTEVRVQRLQDISEQDAKAEGYWENGKGYGCFGLPKRFERTEMTQDARSAYIELWDRLNDARGYGWKENPWVVALTFDVAHRNIDAVAATEHRPPLAI